MKGATRKVSLATMPAPQFLDGADVSTDGARLVLRLSWAGQNVPSGEGLVFGRTRASRWRAEPYCTAWHIDGAYNALLEIIDSEWVAELLQKEPAQSRGPWKMRHFMIYVQDTGCYEVIAESWRFLSEDDGRDE